MHDTMGGPPRVTQFTTTIRHRRSLRRGAACVLALLWNGGCATISAWRAPAEVRAPDTAVAAAIGDTYPSATPEFDPGLIPLPPEPTNLRPCCAFGADLRVAVGLIPVPGLTLGNIRGPKDLGPHKYNVGLLANTSSNASGLLESEENGLVYTCRGGFIDIAHVRDCADMTVYLTAQVSRNMDPGGNIELSDQGGARRIVLNPINKKLIADPGRYTTAVALAQWLTFQLSVWHEIATWYGYGTMPGWPEKISAFSPEDLYSDLIGIKLAAGISFRHDANDEQRYNEAMDAWIPMVLKRLQAVPKQSGGEAIRSVAGIWWNPAKLIPDWQLTMRRNMELGVLIKPWIVSAAFAPDPAPYDGCKDAGPPLWLRNPDGFEGEPFTDYVTLQIEVNDELASHGFPFPRTDSHRITQADFPAIIASIRAENAATFGERADQPKK